MSDPNTGSFRLMSHTHQSNTSTGRAWHRMVTFAVAAFTALKLDGQAAKFGQSALNVGLSLMEIVETVIQTGPYSGLAPALNALAALGQALR
jgi:alkylhydroperoxidase/carboxymuconolactone decarboxylase family protein YurZ